MSYKLIQPDSLSGALAALTEHGEDATVIAGGTAVVLMLQQRLIAPEALLNLGNVPDLAYIRQEEYALHIGPLTPLRDVERSALVQKYVPMLAAACGEVGNVRVRNQATLGGNIVEADYASDPPAALLALDAQVTASRANSSRTILLADFYLGFYTTVLEPDELITDIVVPIHKDSSMTYLKYKSRSSEDRPCVGVAALAKFEDGACSQLSVAVGAACEIPTRLPEYESLANGEILTDQLIAEIASGYADNIDTLDDMRGSAWYRTQMIRTHVRRALEEIRNDHR